MENLNEKTAVGDNGQKSNVNNEMIEDIENDYEKTLEDIKERYKRDIVDIVNDYIDFEFDGLDEYTYIKYSDYENQAVEMFNETLYNDLYDAGFKGDHFEDYEELPDFYEELTELFVENFRKQFYELAKAEVEKALEDYESVGIAAGYSSLDFHFAPVYKIYSKELFEDEMDLRSALIDLGVKPHAWGISGWNGWGNYCFIVLNKNNYKKVLNNLDVALVCYISDRNFDYVYVYPDDIEDDEEEE